jgi:PKD repeat protein
MKKLLLFILSVFLSFDIISQTCSDAAVEVDAVVQKSPAQITLNWLGNATTTNYNIYRKAKTATGWGLPLATLSGTINTYADNTVTVGVPYEYRVLRSGSGYTGYGYICSGIEIPEVSNRGKIILMVDSTFITPLATELKRLETDLEGDGWTVIRHNVLRTGSVTHVKSLVVSDYTADPANTKALFIVGHVPVPYSGNLGPDGHPDHQGAWPTDTYYADVNGVWTDVSVTSTTASPARTQNIPGDGKFDQSLIPTDIELQTGRVDFANLPAFAATEQTLLKNYLDKDHDYRKKVFTVTKQALVDDNFGFFGGEAFAASGFKNFAPLVGKSNIQQVDYFTSMATTGYQWSYGCGGGTYTSASGVGATSNFATSNLQGVFTMLFGSYFGDFDATDDFLRAALAQGKMLVNMWSGRPHWMLHHMGLGDNIGYDAVISQNNNSLYFFNYGGRFIHTALMGDPTLRNDIVAPVSNVVATKVGNNCNITWSASAEPGLLGYNIYMKNDTNKAYVKLNSAPVASTSYTDNCLLYKGTYTYMVRALILQTSPSGTYFNMSEGIADTAYSSNGMKAYASFSSSTGMNPMTFTNTSVNTTSYLWNFGDGGTSTSLSPSHSYTASGTYTISLISSNGCHSDTVYKVVNMILTGISEVSLGNEIIVFPNPSNGKIKILLEDRNLSSFDVSIFDSEGRLVFNSKSLVKQTEIDLSHCSKGLYLIHVNTGHQRGTKRFVIH